MKFAPREPLAAKVPEIGLMFWVVKILTTGMGEAAADYLGNIDVALAAVLGLTGFVLAVWLQFQVRRYVAVVYWFAVGMLAIFGTMAADALHVLSLPYAASTTIYALIVAGIFYAWYRSEGTLSIHSITTTRREVFYWLTVLATFALGTAAGDLTAGSLRLGYFSSGVLFAIAIALPAIARLRFGLNEVVAFWCAYVLTRPLGASFADWLGKPQLRAAHKLGSASHGLGWGDGTVTAIALVAIIGLVGYLAATRHDIQPDSVPV